MHKDARKSLDPFARMVSGKDDYEEDENKRQDDGRVVVRHDWRLR